MNRIKGVYLLLGTNLGNKKENLEKALQLIDSRAGTVVSRSSFYETAAWGYKDQPSFFNMVAEISTHLSPQLLLTEINAIEKEMGRIRYEKWKERTIDIDILYYNGIILDMPELIIPHPGIPLRRFTLVPLVETAPDFIHPSLHMTQKELLEVCPDQLEVKKIEVGS